MSHVEATGIDAAGPYGFVAGTLVHTVNGTVPIQNIRAGDSVLSRSDFTNEQTFKRVMGVRQIPATQVCMVELYTEEERKVALNEKRTMPIELFQYLVMTDNQPLYVKGAGCVRSALSSYAKKEPALGWINATWLLNEDKLAIQSNHHVALSGPSPMYITFDQDIAFASTDRNLNYGRVVYLMGGSVSVEQDYDANIGFIEKDGAWFENETRFQRAVYSLQVEDFHTYFVGESGVWAHANVLSINS